VLEEGAVRCNDPIELIGAPAPAKPA
jgi:MOSC domain-containing protein YiiM